MSILRLINKGALVGRKKGEGRRRKRGSRRRPARAERRRILVVTEGLRTEKQYVERLNGFLRSRGSTTVVRSVGVGKDPLKVVEECIIIRQQAAACGDEKKFDECVCLVDVDKHSTMAQAIRLARAESIQLIVSNLKFEVWICWHADDRCGPLSSKQLDARVKKLGLMSGKDLASTFPIDKVATACAIARKADAGLSAGRVGPDPSTAMPVLVELLTEEK
ncbi:RloB family protein [Corynebacterium mendelii]